MSQDWTPREQLLAESLLDGRTWRDVAKGLSFVKQDGTTVPMYEESTLNFINQFDYLSRIGFDAIYPIYKKYGEKCKEALKIVESHLYEYIQNNIIKEKWIVDWFEGKLDENFYYSTENNRLFFKYVEQLMGIENDDEDEEE